MARFLVKTADRLLKEGWKYDADGDLEPPKWAGVLIVKPMFKSLGKVINLEGGETLWQDDPGVQCWTWDRSAVLDKKDIINEFFNK